MKRKLCSIIMAVLMLTIFTGTAMAESVTDCPNGTSCTTHAVAIGTTHYTTLEEAVAAAPTGNKAAPSEATVIKLLKDTNDGFDIGNNDGSKAQNIVIDLNNHTLTLGPAIGSPNTKTNGMRVLAYSQCEVKNGTVICSDMANSENTYVKTGMANYSMLTLTDVDLQSGSYVRYTINNRGELTLAGTTKVESGQAEPKIAITNDPYNFFYTATDASLNVASEDVEVGKIQVERRGNAQNTGAKVVLNISAGSFGEIVEDGKTQVEVNGQISGGNFESDIRDYLASNQVVVLTSKDDTLSYTVVPDTDLSDYADAVKADGTDDKLYYENTTVANEAAVAKIGDKYYDDLHKALAAAVDNDTITLLNDVALDAPAGTYDQTGALNINKDITLDGNGHKITANDGFDSGKIHMLNVVDGAKVTIKNLTIDGANKAKHGINVYSNDAEARCNVKLTKVTIKNCKGYGLVSNASNVEVTRIITSGNGWGGINIDNSTSASIGGGSFTMNSGTLNEPASLVIENQLNTDNGADATIKGGTFNGAVVLSNVNKGANLKIKKGTFKGFVGEMTGGSVSDNPSDRIAVSGGKFSNSVADYVDPDLNYELKSDADDTYTYYKTLDDVLSAASPADTITDLSISTSADTVTVTFDYDYSGNEYAVVVEKGTEITLPDAERSGYAFLGWQNGITLYDAGYKVTVNADKTFTAKWEKIGEEHRVKVWSVVGGTVTADPKYACKDETVTLMVKADSGYELDKLVVTDEDGNNIKLTSKGNGKYTFTMPNSKVYVDASFKKINVYMPFIDVDSNNWFYDEVAYVYENGLMTGTTYNTFSPHATLNRAMLVQILYNLEGHPTVRRSAGFNDVNEDLWYADAVNWASYEGIVKGYGDNSFKPTQDITREQLASILYRYACYKNYDVSVGSQNSIRYYSDYDEISEYALSAMRWACYAGVMQGSNNKLNPKGFAKRAEAATMLMNFCENVTY